MKIIKKNSFLETLAILLVLFLIVFPKGGFKIHGLPITWGYLFLAIISLFLLFRKKYHLKKDRIYLLILMAPFQIFSFLSIFINGIENISFTISFFISFFALPFIFLIILGEYIDDLNIDFFYKIFKRSILFVASFGIFIFFYKIFFGKIFEIPLLTINYHEKGLIETIKSSDRGNLFKLISTYNNGNIYGLCLLMFYPLYMLLEKNKFKKIILFFSLILTLSRTIWIGLIISEFFYRFFVSKQKISSFFKYIFSFLIIFLSIVVIFKKLDYPITWFFNDVFEKRFNSDYLNIKLISSKPFVAIDEMLYLSILNIFGIMGLIFFLIALFSPIVIFILKNIKNKISKIDKSIISGLVTYLIISFNDGAILYIPIMAFYFFLSSFLYKEKKMDIMMENSINQETINE